MNGGMNGWRWLYARLWAILPPLVNRYLRKRARQQPEYLEHWDERWARGEPRADDAHGAIWVHAVSVGETRAAAAVSANTLRLAITGLPHSGQI